MLFQPWYSWKKVRVKLMMPWFKSGAISTSYPLRFSFHSVSKLVEIGVEGAYEGSVHCFGRGIWDWELCSPMVSLKIHASSFRLFQGNNGYDGMFNYAFYLFSWGNKRSSTDFSVFTKIFIFFFYLVSGSTIGNVNIYCSSSEKKLRRLPQSEMVIFLLSLPPFVSLIYYEHPNFPSENSVEF